MYAMMYACHDTCQRDAVPGSPTLHVLQCCMHYAFTAIVAMKQQKNNVLFNETVY